MRVVFRWAALCAAVTVLFAASVPANAQTPRPENERRPLGGLFSQPDRNIGSLVPMEGAIDEDEYVIGPGDIFAVTIGGPEPTVVSLPVSADGRLLIPGIGSVEVAGKVLREARADVISMMRPSFLRVQLDVALAQPRQFYVHVSGAVTVPGRYLATPVARVSSVLEFAYADTTQFPVGNADFRPSFRDITLKRQDGSERSLDMQRYFSTGDREHNPYLQDGDVISVGVYDPKRESVYIDGAVPYPGSYAYRDGDTAMDLIAIATGENSRLSGVREVRLTRRADGELNVQTVRVGDGERLDIALHPLDHVHVVADETLRGSAEIGGWVRFPGTYPIEPGVTTLDELVEMGGGLRAGALLGGIYLQRRSLPAPELDMRDAGRFDFSPQRGQIVRMDSLTILRNMRLTDLDFLSRAYFAQELRLQNRVSIDPRQLQAGSGDSIVLEDGDRLVVPRDERTVYVFGQVHSPGYVAVREGADVEYYITAAGGRSPLSSGTYVIEAGTGRQISARGAVISSGDMIFVDRYSDIADSAELQRLIFEEDRSRRENRFRTTQTIASVVSAAATIVTTYLLVRDR